jgi:hypothetical protein
VENARWMQARVADPTDTTWGVASKTASNAAAIIGIR